MINYPIQSSLSDIVVESMVKLAEMSVELGIDDLAPALLIHDDLTFMIREDLLEQLLPIIIEVMIDTREYEDWLTVPLEVEVATGKSWGSLDPLGVFSSKDWSFAFPCAA